MKKRNNSRNGSSNGRGAFGTRRGAAVGSAIEALEPRRLLSTYTVNTLADPTTIASGVLSLRQAVADANAHAGADSIVFASSLFSTSGLKTITLLHGQLGLTDTTGATTITGPGASKLAISGNSASRVFELNPKASATISSLTITKGVGAIGIDGKYDGGGIENQGTLTLVSSTLTGNTSSSTSFTASNASGHGGGVFSSGTLIIQSSTLSSNSAVGTGETGAGVGYTGAGGAIYSTGTVTITASTLTANSAQGAPGQQGGSSGSATGGAVYTTGKLTVSTSTFSANSAIAGDDSMSQFMAGGSASGGAIFSTSTVTLNQSTVTGNKADGGTAGYGTNGGAYGGGVFDIGLLTLSQTVVSNNSVQSGDDEAQPVNAPAEGGGIYSTGGMTLSVSVISGNAAKGGTGLYAGDAGSAALGGGAFVSGALTVSSSTISGNSATGGTGDFSSHSPPVPLGPGGNAQGGGVWCSQAATFTNTTIANNKATGGTGGSAANGIPAKGVTGGTGGNASGGGVYASKAIKLFDSTVSGNSAAGGAGGAGYSYSDGAFPKTAAGKAGTAVGGGLTLVLAGSSVLDNTIVSANKSGSVFNDIGGIALSTSANNLIGVGGGLTNGVHGNKVGITAPKLSALGNNGGFTQTMLPLAGSAAIDAGSNALIPAGVTVDQRGDPRIVNQIVDIGADET